MKAVLAALQFSWQPWMWEFADLKKVLAVLGGALLGGVFVALAAQGATKLFTGQTMPRWMVRLVGVLGGIVGGWIVALLLSSGGGGGEGPGGPGSGSVGIGIPSGQTGHQETAPTSRSENNSTNRSTAETLRVDVLEQPEVRRLAGEEGVTARRYFRIQGRSDLLSPDELKRAVEKRRLEEPKLKYLDLVLQGKDSPSEGSNMIHDLVSSWGPENKITVRVVNPGGG